MSDLLEALRLAYSEHGPVCVDGEEFGFSEGWGEDRCRGCALDRAIIALIAATAQPEDGGLS